jgi:hypothetical protein
MVEEVGVSVVRVVGAVVMSLLSAPIITGITIPRMMEVKPGSWMAWNTPVVGRNRALKN